jgi:hypothetical protein
MNCIICGIKADKAHIRSKGAGGPDDEWNILFLCRAHHIVQHAYGWRKFRAQFPAVDSILKSRGWYFDDFGKHWHDSLNK